MRERVGGQADERRREDAVERGLVARVGERGEPGAEVADDLAAPVAAAADRQRQQVLVLERALVDRQVAEAAQQDDDLLGPRVAAVDEVADALREQACLGVAPRLRARQLAEVGRVVAVPAGLVGQQQLDERRRTPAAGSRPSRSATKSAPRRGANAALIVSRIGPRLRKFVASVATRPCGRQRRAARAEDLDVGVAKAVDRLLLVADHEEVVAVERLEQRDLAAVGVLELVDHDAVEALGVAAPQRRLGEQQVAGEELEVVEVQRRALALGVGVGARVAAQQVVETGDGGAGGAVAASAGVRRERAQVARAGLGLQRVGGRAEPQLREHRGATGRRRPQARRRRGGGAERGGRAARGGAGAGADGAGPPGGGAAARAEARAERRRRAAASSSMQRATLSRASPTRLPAPASASSRGGRRRGRRELVAQRARLGGDRRARQHGVRQAVAAQRVVDPRDHRAQAVGVVGGDDVQRRGAVLAVEPVGERAIPRLVAQRARRGLVEHGERRVQARRRSRARAGRARRSRGSSRPTPSRSRAPPRGARARRSARAPARAARRRPAR